MANKERQEKVRKSEVLTQKLADWAGDRISSFVNDIKYISYSLKEVDFIDHIKPKKEDNKPISEAIFKEVKAASNKMALAQLLIFLQAFAVPLLEVWGKAFQYLGAGEAVLYTLRVVAAANVVLIIQTALFTIVTPSILKSNSKKAVKGKANTTFVYVALPMLCLFAVGVVVNVIVNIGLFGRNLPMFIVGLVGNIMGIDAFVRTVRAIMAAAYCISDIGDMAQIRGDNPTYKDADTEIEIAVASKATRASTADRRETESKPIGRWKCGKCGNINTSNKCEACNNPRLSIVCQDCGYADIVRRKFCPECGAKDMRSEPVKTKA